MNTRIGVVALVLSTIALGVAIVAAVHAPAPTTTRAPRAGTDARVVTLEARVAQLSRELAALRAGRRGGGDSSEPEAGTDTSEVEGVGSPSDRPADETALAAVVSAAVDRKTKQVLDELRVKENKKPAMDVFASMLKLTPEQRAATERVVVEGQRKVHDILEMPTSDGTNLMDDLVEIAAWGFAEPGKDHGWGQWLARVIGEKIPGTDETYGTRIEAVKVAMRSQFKRDWSEAQYKEFQAWGVDPTEIEKVPGSPNAALFERITTRARQLGAEIPEDK